MTVLSGIMAGALAGSLIGGGISYGLLSLFDPAAAAALAERTEELPDSQNQLLLKESSLITIQNNSLASLSSPYIPEKSVWAMKVVITAYSSTPWECDDDPFITAAGTYVRDGIVANNYLSMGTKIRIPQLFGDKVFVVEDRMHWTKSNSHIDIWFPSYQEAKNFGVKNTYIEILEN